MIIVEILLKLEVAGTVNSTIFQKGTKVEKAVEILIMLTSNTEETPVLFSN